MWQEIKELIDQIGFTTKGSPFYWPLLILYFFVVLFVIWIIRKLWELAGK